MPFLGMGLHILVALYFAVHAVRHGQQLYWLVILFSFPLLGSLVYFVVIYLPNSRLERNARKVMSAAAKSLDPGRDVREARAAFDYTPTAQNQMRLAAALLDNGQAEEAATNYAACLKGPFASDLEIRLGAARAFLACGRADDALTHLDFIRQNDAAWRAEHIALLKGQALAATNRHAEAGAAYREAVDRFGSFECRAEYAIWAAATQQDDLADRLREELKGAMARWNRHTHELNRELVRRLNTAFDQSRRERS